MRRLSNPRQCSGRAGAVLEHFRRAPGHSWETVAWNAFRIRFKKVVEAAWNKQMILLPPDGGEVDGERRFPDPALGIGDCNNHGPDRTPLAGMMASNM